MEKICIVKRRKIHYDRAAESLEGSPPAVGDPASLQVVSIALTAQQSEAIRSNGHFQELCQGQPSQIVFNLHLLGEPLPRMVTTREVCEMLQVSRHTVSKLVRTGAVQSYKIGRLRRFSGQDIIEYLSHSAAIDTRGLLRVEAIAGSEQEARPAPL
jgi:excisionase family DNA binding protein